MRSPKQRLLVGRPRRTGRERCSSRVERRSSRSARRGSCASHPASNYGGCSPIWRTRIGIWKVRQSGEGPDSVRDRLLAWAVLRGRALRQDTSDHGRSTSGMRSTSPKPDVHDLQRARHHQAHPRAQAVPAVTSVILEGGRDRGCCRLDFHLLGIPWIQLLTNWVWWRTYMRDRRMISGISSVYGSEWRSMCRFERNLSELEAFAGGGPRFLPACPGTPFLSFQEFVGDRLFIRSATLSLRTRGLRDRSEQRVRGEIVNV